MSDGRAPQIEPFLKRQNAHLRVGLKMGRADQCNTALLSDDHVLAHPLILLVRGIDLNHEAWICLLQSQHDVGQQKFRVVDHAQDSVPVRVERDRQRYCRFRPSVIEVGSPP